MSDLWQIQRLNMRRILFLIPVLLMMACSSTVSLDESEIQSEEQEMGKVSSSRSSSSSLPAISSWEEDTSKIKKLDEFPIDTGEGLTIDHIAYVTDYADGRLVPEMQEKFGDDVGNVVVVYDSSEYCHVVYSSTGTITASAVRELNEDTYVLINREDSLLFEQTMLCTDLSWDGCMRRGNGYMEKIMVGNEVYYYSEDSHYQELVQLKGSNVYRWLIMNPDYRESMQWKGWDKSLFANDSMVTFISDDTLFIEKYNLKITDEEKTWVFENETCSPGVGEDKSVIEGMEVHQYCNLLQRWYDESIACIQHNMGVSSDVYPRLCRKANKTYSDKVWCILD